MASAWGKSWGKAWGDAWGKIVAAPPPLAGGYDPHHHRRRQREQLLLDARARALRIREQNHLLIQMLVQVAEEEFS